MIIINISLGVINLIPIPPLDGSKVITIFMSRQTMFKWLSLNSYVCFIVLIVLLWSGFLGRILYPIIRFLVGTLGRF
jgi:Zn-dependent protease